MYLKIIRGRNIILWLKVCPFIDGYWALCLLGGILGFIGSREWAPAVRKGVQWVSGFRILAWWISLGLEGNVTGAGS